MHKALEGLARLAGRPKDNRHPILPATKAIIGAATSFVLFTLRGLPILGHLPHRILWCIQDSGIAHQVQSRLDWPGFKYQGPALGGG